VGDGDGHGTHGPAQVPFGLEKVAAGEGAEKAGDFGVESPGDFGVESPGHL
jgi:hypothetical protein